ncbi:MAG: ATP-dependent DNA helicase [Deltaproteobacteria bacterium]|nr:ATP-dependent DNA helicase [Deltaproteobacteria bacterium]
MADPFDDLKRFFGPDGLLAGSVDGYEERQAQAHMARKVMEALVHDGTLIAEAPTGTGKTLAYLIPALLYDRRVVISTGTKNLQEQIMQKDWPFLRDEIGFDAKVVVMKGRENYLCRARWAAYNRQGRFRSPQEAKDFTRLSEWVHTTETGDRAELSWLADDDPLWREVNSNQYNCPGKVCNGYEDCFLRRMRRKADSADIIVVNHHLFFADLALKHSSPGAVIPEYHGVIFDEAHDLEDVATAYFAARISNYMMQELHRDLAGHFGKWRNVPEACYVAMDGLADAADAFFDNFRMTSSFDSKRRFAPATVPQKALEDFDRMTTHLSKIAYILKVHAPVGEDEGDTQDAFTAALKDRVVGTLGASLAVMDSEDTENVRYVESRGRGVHLVAEPIEPGPKVRDALFSTAGPVVFTSATLSTAGNFKYFRGRMALDFAIEEDILPTCFDYATQALLYVPKLMPEPNSPDFVEAFCVQAERILTATQGRAFLLFTSYRNMREAFEMLSGRLPYKTMMQGQGSKSALIEDFRKDTHSVLFATASFWQGVDVAGQALSCVIVDKLPFQSPGDPLIEARIDAINARGENAFMDYQLPRAILALKQGLGRLIRRRTDRGILALMDTRVLTRRYGKTVLKSLPEFPVTNDMAELERYAATLDSPLAPTTGKPPLMH